MGIGRSRSFTALRCCLEGIRTLPNARTNGSEVNMSGFGAELYRLRCARGMSQIDLARRACLTRGYYSQIENSKRFPPPSTTLDRIARAMLLSADQTAKLRKLADAERCRMITLPNELPLPVAKLVWQLTSRASCLSPAVLREMATLLGEDPSM